MFDKHKSSKQNTPVTHEPKVSPPAPSVSGKAPTTPSRVAMIGKGISISGDVKAETSLRIEGRIEGRGIQGTKDIEIAESGHVVANVMAKEVKISGVVSGDIGGSEKVFISRTGQVQGNIIAPRVQLEDGALFKGSIDMTPIESAGAEKPTAVKPSDTKVATPEKSSKPSAAKTSPAKTSANGADRKEPSLNLKSG